MLEIDSSSFHGASAVNLNKDDCTGTSLSLFGGVQPTLCPTQNHVLIARMQDVGPKKGGGGVRVALLNHRRHGYG